MPRAAPCQFRAPPGPVHGYIASSVRDRRPVFWCGSPTSPTLRTSERAHSHRGPTTSITVARHSINVLHPRIQLNKIPPRVPSTNPTLPPSPDAVQHPPTTPSKMHLLTLLTAAATAHAFTVPANLPNGIYSVAIDARGNALSTPLLVRSLSPPSRITPRQNQAPSLPNPSTNCHNRQFASSRAEYDAALKAFNSVVCDPATMYQAGAAIWISVADAKTVPYMCNYEAANRCWTSESNEADGLLNKQCGASGIGWVYVDQYKKSYGRENVGQGGSVQIC